MFHAGRDTGALSADQLLENERTYCAPAAARHCSVGGGASSRPVAAARLARVHVWHVSPHGGNGKVRTATAVPCLILLLAMPRLARHATPAGGGMPCPAAHDSHCGRAMPCIITSYACENLGIEISNVLESSAAARLTWRA